MKSTGIIRNVDGLGRVVVPKEMRAHLNWPIGTPLEIRVNGDQVVLAAYRDSCSVCRGFVDTATDQRIGGSWVCHDCRTAIRSHPEAQ